LRRTVVINWQMTSIHGWGVYGLNLALNWAADPDIAPVSGHPVDLDKLHLDALSLTALAPVRQATEHFVQQLAARPDGEATSSGPVLLALNGELRPEPAAHGVQMRGRPTVGIPFIETAHLPDAAVARVRSYDLVVAGSGWNAELLRAYGAPEVRTVIQGVDRALFHPAPRRGLMPDRFLVFSGGKLERRKGQDLALAAFKVFAGRHPDALLVTAWHSPWPHVARTLDASGLAAPVPFAASGAVDVAGWAVVTGIPANQVLDLGLVPNASLPPVLREMDVALFANRCEGGTNLVAMECMACGVPAILSKNTGHLDLIEEGACYQLERQGELTGREGPFGDVAGWGESDVDEIVAALEAAYADRDEARRRGLAGAARLERYSWAATARGMKDAVLPLARS
jgi:glycosyltransferase involved in cell wall biosynthesis